MMRTYIEEKKPMKLEFDERTYYFFFFLSLSLLFSLFSLYLCPTLQYTNVSDVTQILYINEE